MAIELSSILLRKSIGSMETARPVCSRCRRSPLTGELLHEFESGRVLCDLCMAELPEEQRTPISSERVRAGERNLATAPHAA